MPKHQGERCKTDKSLHSKLAYLADFYTFSVLIGQGGKRPIPNKTTNPGYRITSMKLTNPGNRLNG